MDAIVVACNPTNVGTLNRLQAYVTALEALPQVQARLFTSNAPIGPTTNLGQLVEANYSGYNPIAIPDWQGVFVDEANTPFADSPLLIFQCSGAGVGNTVYSVGITASTGAAATGTAGQTGGVVDTPVVTAGGSGYESAPRVVVTDATVGTGATAHAVITNGVVTSIVIDSGGTGYTGPILTIDRPAKLIAGANFAGGKRMTFDTDAVAVVAELNDD